MPAAPHPEPLRMTMRAALPDDATSMAQVWRRAWASANPAVAEVAPPSHWEARVQDEFTPPCVVRVVEQAGRVAGFGVVDPQQAYLCQLFVDPPCQGQGWGAALLGWVCATCPSGWSLHVAETNEGARRFYERHGLRPGLRDIHLATGRARVRYHWAPAQAQASAASISPASFSGASWGA